MDAKNYSYTHLILQKFLQDHIMNNQPLLFFAVVFLVWAGIAGLLVWLIFPDRFKQRLAGLQEDSALSGTEQISNPWVERIVQAANPFIKLSLPSEGWDNSPIRIRFIRRVTPLIAKLAL